MTNEQMLELVKEHFEEGGIQDDGSCSEYYGETDAFVKFAQEIRKQTIDEILTTLEEVPNPEANRTAINRILNKYYD